MGNKRWEVDYNGDLVWQDAATLSENTKKNKVTLLKKIFERDGWSCEITDDSNKFISVKLTNTASESEKKYSVVLVNVVNEYRAHSDDKESNSSYEKRIQGQDFTAYTCENKLIFGIYAFKEDEDIENSIIVSWPEEILTTGANRAYRVSTKDIIKPARQIGLYADKNSAYNVVAFKPEFIYMYLENKGLLHRFESHNICKDNSENMDEELNDEELNTEINKPYNRIIFGAPGTGKSSMLKQESEVFNENKERVTFHPKYSYSQFVGTYKPVPFKDNDNESITYEFVPGPFTRILTKALKNRTKPYLLIIEEINRANVSAVFGDIFQLIERDESGCSQYKISINEDMKRYLAKNVYKEEYFGCKDEESLQKIIDRFNEIYIPNNMYIWATMNSADQGVYPIDTAFKRRWDFEYLSVDDKADKIEEIKFVLKNGEKQYGIVWNDLRKKINDILSDECNVNEDKLLGPFFIDYSIMKFDSDTKYVVDNNKFISTFKNKVLMYLFDDAAKQYRSRIFKGCNTGYNRYSTICSKFDEIGERLFGDELNLTIDNLSSEK